MTRITDWRDAGIFPLQDHDQGVPLGRRQMMAGARIAKLDDPGSSAQVDIEVGEESRIGTIGDIHPWLYWQTNGRATRATGSWAMAWAGIYGEGYAAGGGPTTGGGGYVSLSPIASESYNADQRYVAKAPAWPQCLSQRVRGQLVTVLPTTEETIQGEIVLHSDPRLVAPGVGGSGDAGTLVVDLQPDDELCMDQSVEPGKYGRAARLQSLVRVVAFAGGGDIIPQEFNGLAWNFSTSQQEGAAGLGMIWSRISQGRYSPQGPITPGGRPTTNPITPGGSSGYDPTQFVVMESGTDGSGNPVARGKKLDEFGAFQRSPSANHGVAFLANIGAGGPIHAGCELDKHKLGEDRDGNPMNAAHISTRALWFDDPQRDGPFFFEGAYPNPAPLPLLTRVHLTWDKDTDHQFVDGSRPGVWRWYGEAPFVTPGGGGGSQIRFPVDDPPPSGPTPSTPTTPGPGRGTTPGPGGPRAPTPPGPTPPGIPGRTGGPRFPTDVPPPGPRGRPITPNPGGVRFPGYPETPGGTTPRGPTTPGGPSAPGQPTPAGPSGGGDGPPSGPTTPGGPVEPFNPRYGRWRPGPKDAESVKSVGEVKSRRSLFGLHYPFFETWSAQGVRPQLWVAGAPNYEHDQNASGNDLQGDETSRPQVLAMRSWAAQQDGDYAYTVEPFDSRARGGTADGGVLFCPPEFEPEDYFDIGETEDVDSPATQSYVTAAPGVAWALGKPVVDGGLTAASVTIAQAATTNAELTISQLDSTRAPIALLTASVDQSTDEVSVVIGGSQALRIPVGDDSERPTSTGGALRISDQEAFEEPEFYDSASGAWSKIVSTLSAMAVGDILVRTANGWETLAAGSNGDVLTIVAGVPAWSAPAP